MPIYTDPSEVSPRKLAAADLREYFCNTGLGTKKTTGEIVAAKVHDRWIRNIDAGYVREAYVPLMREVREDIRTHGSCDIPGVGDRLIEILLEADRWDIVHGINNHIADILDAVEPLSEKK